MGYAKQQVLQVHVLINDNAHLVHHSFLFCMYLVVLSGCTYDRSNLVNSVKINMTVSLDGSVYILPPVL